MRHEILPWLWSPSTNGGVFWERWNSIHNHRYQDGYMTRIPIKFGHADVALFGNMCLRISFTKELYSQRVLHSLKMIWHCDIFLEDLYNTWTTIVPNLVGLSIRGCTNALVSPLSGYHSFILIVSCIRWRFLFFSFYSLLSGGCRGVQWLIVSGNMDMTCVIRRNLDPESN